MNSKPLDFDADAWNDDGIYVGGDMTAEQALKVLVPPGSSPTRQAAIKGLLKCKIAQGKTPFAASIEMVEFICALEKKDV